MSTSVYTILLWIHLTSAWWHTDHPPPSVSGNQVGIGVLSHLLSYESVILVSACCWCTQVCDLTLGSFDISMMTYWPPYPSLLVNQVGIGVLELSDDLINQSWFLHNSGEHKCVHNLTLNSFDISMMACWPASPSLLDNQVGIGVLEPSDDLRQTFKVPDLGFCMLLMYTSVWSYSSFIWHQYDGINTDPCPPLASLCQVIKLALVYWNYLMTIWINDQVPTFCFPRLLKNTSVPFLFTPGTWSKGGACRSTGCPGWLVRSFIGFLSSL